jgi:DnaJ-class molecular chaperone
MTKEKDKVVIVIPGANTPEAWNRWTQVQCFAYRLRARLMEMAKAGLLPLPKSRKCRACDGTGDTGRNSHERQWDPCPKCNGTGEIE